MKRSKALKLSLMGASALTLVACDNSQEVGVFETIDQCVDKAGFTRDACEANQKVAQAEHIRVSPKYTSLFYLISFICELLNVNKKKKILKICTNFSVANNKIIIPRIIQSIKINV